MLVKLSIFDIRYSILIISISLIEAQNEVNALWRWIDDPNHYLINEKNSDDWFEVQDEQVISKYVLWDVDDPLSTNPIIYDDRDNIFIEILGDGLVYGSNDVSSLNDGNYGAFGGWAIKPGFEIPIVPLPSVEVYLLPVVNRIGRRDLFDSVEIFRNDRTNIVRNTNVENNIVSVNNVINNNDHDHIHNRHENDFRKDKERKSNSRKEVRKNEIRRKEKPKDAKPIHKPEHKPVRKSPNKPAKSPKPIHNVVKKPERKSVHKPEQKPPNKPAKKPKQEHKVEVRKEPRKPSNKGEKRPKSNRENRKHH